MIKKGKRAPISNRNNKDIMLSALKNRDTPRTELAEQLKRELKWEGKAPEIEVLERKISWYRNHSTDSPEEKTWSTATLEDYPVPPEAVAAILKVWQHRIHTEWDDDVLKPLPGVTIREAKWISRLASYVDDTQKLSEMAKAYASLEMTDDVIERTYDSTFMDWILMGFGDINIQVADNTTVNFDLPEHLEYMRPKLMRRQKKSSTLKRDDKLKKKPYLADLYFRKYHERLPGC